MLINKLAPVAQRTEHPPPKPTADRWQVAARASNPPSPLSNKIAPSCAKPRGVPRFHTPILDT
jgi:hypothetical protein